MGLSIRRGTTKTLCFTIPPYCSEPDGTVSHYMFLPTKLPVEDAGKLYKVLNAYSEYPEKSYYEWSGYSWQYKNSDKQWKSLGTVHVRIVQGSLVLDKEFSDWNDEVLTVKYSQEDTLSLKEGKPAKLQIFCVNGEGDDEQALKSQQYSISVLDSLWNEVVHNE